MKRSVATFAFLISAACAAGQTKAKQTAPPVQASTTRETIRFEDLATAAGIRFKLDNSVSDHRYSIETMAGGVAAFDYDNDGLLDLFFTNGAAIPSLEKTGPRFWNRLFHNNGDGTFTDVTEKAGVQGRGYSMGVSAADYDNDGFVDLYITGVNFNQLLHNNGNGTFTDVTEKAGVQGIQKDGSKGWAVTSGWFDYNNDGKLDLLVVQYLKYDLKTAATCSRDKATTYCSPDDFQGLPNILYRNNGDGTFTDVSAQTHFADFIGKGMGLAFADYDHDGRTDVFLSNDTFPNFLIHNNADGTFSEEALAAGVAYKNDGKVVAGMGADFRDLDNDGLPDIFHTAMFADSFPLYRNNSNGQFDDETAAYGLAAGTARFTGWGMGAYDLDNDCFKDLFTANAAILDNAEIVEHRPYPQPDAIFHNDAGRHFTDVTTAAGAAINQPLAHRGAAFGDFNNDGRIDLAVTVLNGQPQLLMNRTGGASPQNHWILLNLVGVQDNRDGLGTQVKITTTLGAQYNQATTAVGYNSASDKRVHFGLGRATKIDRIDLWWPTGIHQVLKDVKADQVLTIREALTSTP